MIDSFILQHAKVAQMESSDNFFARIEDVADILLVSGHGAMDKEIVTTRACGSFELCTEGMEMEM